MVGRESALAKVDEYIAHRITRETQLVEALNLRRNRGNGWVCSWDLMCAIYPPLPFFVRVSAQWNVSHHLDKLLEDGKVETCFPDQWRLKIKR